MGKPKPKMRRDPKPVADPRARNHKHAQNPKLCHAWDAAKVATAVSMGAVTVSPRPRDHTRRLALPGERKTC